MRTDCYGFKLSMKEWRDCYTGLYIWLCMLSVYMYTCYGHVYNWCFRTAVSMFCEFRAVLCVWQCLSHGSSTLQVWLPVGKYTLYMYIYVDVSNLHHKFSLNWSPLWWTEVQTKSVGSCFTYTVWDYIALLQDLANAHGTKLQESFLFYYTAELLEMVASLHHCGILHTDIKPDNFMIADIRWEWDMYMYMYVHHVPSPMQNDCTCTCMWAG